MIGKLPVPIWAAIITAFATIIAAIINKVGKRKEKEKNEEISEIEKSETIEPKTIIPDPPDLIDLLNHDFANLKDIDNMPLNSDQYTTAFCTRVALKKKAGTIIKVFIFNKGKE